ncbi:MAG: helix-turn-helix transcriptional regulator [Candidatus Binataceae bacterium]
MTEETHIEAEASQPARLLKPRAVAEILGISESGLYQLRRSGRGPSFIDIGNGRKPNVRYRASDLEQWLARREALNGNG